VVHRVVLCERGIVLAGPPPTALIDPITPDELRWAQVELMQFWWAPIVGKGSAADYLRLSGHQPLAVLMLCRMLYTLRTGEITSKSAAAHWGLATLGPRASDRRVHMRRLTNASRLGHAGRSLALAACRTHYRGVCASH
jgi:hypothetical protein